MTFRVELVRPLANAIVWHGADFGQVPASVPVSAT